jgi:hypothetical protein
MENELGKMIADLPLGIHTLPILLVLKRWRWIMEDEDESEDQLDFFCEMSRYFQNVESLKEWMNDIFWGEAYDNTNPEWLEMEWGIVSYSRTVTYPTFNSKEHFVECLDFEVAQTLLAKAWNNACNEES